MKPKDSNHNSIAFNDSFELTDFCLHDIDYILSKAHTYTHHHHTHPNVHISFNQPNLRWTWLNNFPILWNLFEKMHYLKSLDIGWILVVSSFLVEWNRSISIERLDTITWWYIIHRNVGMKNMEAVAYQYI